MSTKLLRAREGFSLAELLIAMTLTAVIGAAITGLFVTQSQFLEQQQKQEFARGVTRSASNIIMSELRMVERDSGIVAASDTSITVRVPYAMGIACTSTASLLTFSMLPIDSIMFTGATIAGIAYRLPTGYYNYRTQTATVAAGTLATCTAVNVAQVPGGGLIKQVALTSALPINAGDPIFLYQNVRYHFSPSTAVPGRRGLYRAVPAANVDEEIVAPFDTSAKFAFYVNDSETPQSAAPASTALSTLTGIEIILNGVSEKPDRNGLYTVVPLRTAVFFKNRRI